MGKLKVKALFLTILIFVACVAASATAMPYKGYTYDEWGKPVPSLSGYRPEAVIWGTDLASGIWKEPKDMFVSSGKDIYILDSGDARIIILDRFFKLKRVLEKFQGPAGETHLANPSGLFVGSNDDIYVADSDNHRVLILTGDGAVKGEIGKPSSPIYPQHNDFRPQRVLADEAGNIYVIVAGLYQGAVVFSPDGKFDGFYGSNRVELTAKILQNAFWKRVMTKEQKKNTERFVPVEYTSFDIDDENFVYTCSDRTQNDFEQLKKLNPMGENIYYVNRYGDYEGSNLKGEWLTTSFNDITVDQDDFIYALDRTRGKVFQYDQEGNLVFIFGTQGSQAGTFTAPAAIDTMDDKVLVLDSIKGNITVFSRTEFGDSVITALKLYNDGLYEEALEPWTKVLKMDSYYSLAYVSLGKTYFNRREYEKARMYFRLGADQKGESKAFKELRTEAIRQNFGVVAAVLILILILSDILRRNSRIIKLLKKFKFIGIAHMPYRRIEK